MSLKTGLVVSMERLSSEMIVQGDSLKQGKMNSDRQVLSLLAVKEVETKTLMPILNFVAPSFLRDKSRTDN